MLPRIRRHVRPAGNHRQTLLRLRPGRKPRPGPSRGFAVHTLAPQRDADQDMVRKTRDFVHVSDLVQALLLLAERSDGCGVFNVGSGEEVSMHALAEVIGSVTGRPATLLQISDVMEDSYRLVADISKIRGLGYVPRMSLAEGVSHLVSELGENPRLPGGETIFKRGQRAEEFALR